MRHFFALFICLSLSWAPQNAVAKGDDLEEGLSLMEQGARLLLRGLMAEMEPRLREMERELERALDDLSAYHPPEILPNGDIIIRRKVPLTPDPEEDDSGDDEPEEPDEIDL